MIVRSQPVSTELITVWLTVTWLHTSVTMIDVPISELKFAGMASGMLLLSASVGLHPRLRTLLLQLITGAMLSLIVIVACVVDVFPQASVAVNMTVVVPVAPQPSERAT